MLSITWSGSSVFNLSEGDMRGVLSELSSTSVNSTVRRPHKASVSLINPGEPACAQDVLSAASVLTVHMFAQ